MLGRIIVFFILTALAAATIISPPDNGVFTALRSYLENKEESFVLELLEVPPTHPNATTTPEKKPASSKPPDPPRKITAKSTTPIPSQAKMPAPLAISPAPLRVEQPTSTPIAPPETPLPPRILSASEILRWTNYNREQNGIPALQKNQKLLEAATAKLSDMFQLQYFEHNSPTGRKAADFIKDTGYEAIVAGENLALGNFESEQQLVQAWMDSPGHRANILNNKYLEIGIAAGQDVLNGRKVWLSVQIFAKPAAVCPRPDAVLLQRIEAEQSTTRTIEENLQVLYAEYLALKEQGGERLEMAIKNYNQLVEQYNQVLESLRSGAKEYNQQVEVWNACLAN